MKPVLIAGIALLGTLVASACSTHFPIRTPPCSPARVCAEVYATQVPECAATPDDRDQNEMYYLRNVHPDPNKAIWVAYQVREDPVNQPALPSRVFVRQRKVEGDSASVLLDCKYEKIGGTSWYRRSHEILSACFEDDPDCEGDNPIQEAPGDTLCDIACSGPNCIHRTLPTADPLEAQSLQQASRTVRQVLTKQPPFSFDLNNLLGLGGVCSRRTLAAVDSQGNFSSLGPSCRLFLGISGNRVVSGLEVVLGPTVDGVISGTSASKTLRVAGPTTDILLQWYGQAGNSLGTEFVSHAVLLPNQVRLSGSRRFCVWLDLPNTD